MQNDRVLIVEDEPHIAEVVALKLRSAGLTCDAVADGVEALHLLQRGDYALVITDVDLPGLDGVSLAHAAAVLPGRTPFLLLTGFRHAIAPIALRGTHVADVLAKPFSPTLLLNKARAIIRGVSAARDAQAAAMAA